MDLHKKWNVIQAEWEFDLKLNGSEKVIREKSSSCHRLFTNTRNRLLGSVLSSIKIFNGTNHESSEREVWIEKLANRR